MLSPMQASDSEEVVTPLESSLQTGSDFLGLIFTFHFWFRDLLRELDKKYEVLLIIFFLVFLLFLVSEGLLFLIFFWTSFHSLSSPTLGTWPGEGFYLVSRPNR